MERVDGVLQKIRRSFREKKKGSYTIDADDTAYENVEVPKDQLKWLNVERLNNGQIMIENQNQNQNQINRRLMRPQRVYNEYTSSPMASNSNRLGQFQNVNHNCATTNGNSGAKVFQAFPVYSVC